MRGLALVVMLFWLVIPGHADEIEDWIEDSQNPEELQRWLDDLSRSPIELNQATRDDLISLPFFDSHAARRVIAARHRAGGFHSARDAREIEGLTSPQRLALERFTVVSEAAQPATRVESRLLAGMDDESHAGNPADWWMRYRGEVLRDDGGS
ncbi:MAG: hypothetical protein PHI18_01130, partial [bacterium]|nr:hypothetical protein [bacterium]